MNKLAMALSLLIALSCHPDSPPPAPIAAGIPHSLALHRAATLSDVRYHLELRIPRLPVEPIVGQETLVLQRRADAGPLVIDFARDRESVRGVRVQAQPVSFRVENGHIVVPEEHLRVGENTLEIDFYAGDSSLNRRENFLYTLFVPDRAHHAVPCFDQPDLKARFTLSLETPEDWRAVAIGKLEERWVEDGRARWTFAESAPIPTYLLAFAAGEFQVETAERDGRTLNFYHRETDAEKVARNREALFDLHAAALAWLEDYTAIDYPFAKLDFALIPGFQYGGMEHPESIFYRDASLLLDKSATQSDFLGRASLIAHEVAHMWFGDLVTMSWFDDVWMKEVFANFMAAKIVHPSFPEINHELSFVLRHFPSAYDVDRSRGANPIRQELANLNEAGSLYGAIIYQKAPIVMRHLELLMGEDELRQGLREYLDQHRYGNASWPDLVATLEPRTDVDLASWSQVWVGESGRPEIHVELASQDARITSFRVLQSDPWERGKRWNQRLSWVLGGPDGAQKLETHLVEGSVEVDEARGWPVPDYILPAGLGYGQFVLDASTRRFLLADIATLEDPVLRGLAWLTLWDEMLATRVAPEALLDTAQAWLESETETQLVEQVLGQLPDLFWRYLAADVRAQRTVDLENLLWARLAAAPSVSLKSSYFRAYRSVAGSDVALRRLREIWRGDRSIPGLPQSEDDLMTLALELAVRQVPDAASILDSQLERIENPDRRQRFAFVMPALSADPQVRAGFFASLKEVANREQERWVLEGLTYLNHPLRAEASRRYLPPALEWLEEIQRTGDIFFPKRWLDAALGGHSSPEAAAIVRSFLAERPEYPARLQGKILQSADGLFRAAGIHGL